MRPLVTADTHGAWAAAEDGSTPIFLAACFPDGGDSRRACPTLREEEERLATAMDALSARGCREIWLPVVPFEEGQRPDPYHAGLAYARWQGGAVLDQAERTLLRRQAARFFALQAQARGWTLRLLPNALPEQDPEQSPLLTYLRGERLLPETVRWGLLLTPGNLAVLEREWPVRRVLYPGLGMACAVSEADEGFPETDSTVALGTLLALADLRDELFGCREGLPVCPFS
jgi:hypothetical protein